MVATFVLAPVVTFLWIRSRDLPFHWSLQNQILLAVLVIAAIFIVMWQENEWMGEADRLQSILTDVRVEDLSSEDIDNLFRGFAIHCQLNHQEVLANGTAMTISSIAKDLVEQSKTMPRGTRSVLSWLKSQRRALRSLSPNTDWQWLDEA